MEAMKEQMDAMMEAIMSVKKIMEANAVAIVATSVVAKVNSTSPSSIVFNLANPVTTDCSFIRRKIRKKPSMIRFKCSNLILHSFKPTIKLGRLNIRLRFNRRRNREYEIFKRKRKTIIRKKIMKRISVRSAS